MRRYEVHCLIAIALWSVNYEFICFKASYMTVFNMSMTKHMSKNSRSTYKNVQKKLIT